ncbi:MAG: hypothetical protein Q9170_003929 [Blastenia crenularia]
MASSAEPIKLPGFGKPLNARDDLKYSVGRTEKFPIALIDEGFEAATLPMREYMIMELVNTITDKPNWQEKVFDVAIVANWRAETLASKPSNGEPTTALRADEPTDTNITNGGLNTPGSEFSDSQWSAYHAALDVSPRMFDWAVAEVRHKAKVFKQVSCVEALDGVWKSDTIIGEDVRKALERAVRPLEDVPAVSFDSNVPGHHDEQDWHPGSNRQVLDLVHPSIYPLVYGQSPILGAQKCQVADCTSWIGKGTTLKFPENSGELGLEWSTNYQWLPAEFETPPGMEDTHIKSYINNLHPRHHPDLYHIIAQIVAKAIPLWNEVLSHVIAPPLEPRVSDWSNSDRGYGESDDEEPQYAGMNSDEECDVLMEGWKDNRKIIEPEPGEFKTPGERNIGVFDKRNWTRHQIPITGVNLREDHGQLQIIVKLANIHLTPAKPEYFGGSWHVEGQANESICASALYYYSTSNITDSYLSFRQHTDADDARQLPYPQDEHRAVEKVFGIKNGGPAVQNLGKVLTRESRLLCFPNVMQHRVSAFKLTDPSRPGHRKLLALFLVDPHIKIISTENVPPQQHAWWRENVEMTGVLQKLPPELAEIVLNGTDFPISLDEAREQRLELMAERKGFSQQNDDVMMDRKFNRHWFKKVEKE